MSFCKFKPHPDTPGRFVCGVCNIPSSRNKTYGPEGPPPRHCPNPPDVTPFIARLADETNHPEIVDDSGPYHQAVQQWAAEGFPVRDEDDCKYIVDVLCPECRHYHKPTCTCGTCGGKGQLVAIKAWMETDTCPAMGW